MVFNSCECVLMCGIQMSVHTHVSDQVDTQCFLVLLFGSLCKLGKHSGRLGVQGAPGSLLPLSACSSVTGITDTLLHSAFMGVLGTSLESLCLCGQYPADTLMKPSLQTHLLVLKYFITSIFCTYTKIERTTP